MSGTGAHDGQHVPSAGAAETHNELSGVVHGPSVQAQAIHGGVHVHQQAPQAPQQPWPRLLPPRAANFTDRDGELAELARLRAEQGAGAAPLVVVLTGPGGVGKSAVALQWLHGIAGEFAGGQLYDDLGGPGVSEAEVPSETLGLFLHHLGAEPQRVPAGLAGRTALFRSLTAERPTLVMLDNAVTAAQVQPLLPTSEGSVVVVTSRWRLGGLVAGAGARVIEVDPLEPGASFDLLTHVLGETRVAAEAEAARALAKLCGGLPIALRVAGATLATRPRDSIVGTVDDLADDRRRLASLTVDEVFDVSYEKLPPDAAELYRLLGLHPGPDFGVGVAAAAAGVPEREARRQLDLLTGASLVADLGGGRYRFHDLVGLHARQRAEQDHGRAGRDDALHRMLRWYLDGAVSADLALMPGRWRLGERYPAEDARPTPDDDAKERAWSWLEAERRNLAAAVHSAGRQRWDGTVWQLCEALWGLYFLRKYYRDWVDTHQLGVEAAQRCGDLRAQGRMRCQLGLAYLDLDRHDEAAEEFAAALDADRAAGHRRGEATALEMLSHLEMRRGRYVAAVDAYRRTRDVTEEVGDPRAIALTWHYLGRALGETGQDAEALDTLRRAWTLVRELPEPDPYNEGRVLTSIGRAHLRGDRPEQAAEPLHQAWAIMRDEGARFEEAQVLESLGELAAHTGEYGQARDCLERALARYDESGAPRAEAVRRRLSDLPPGPSS